MLNKEEEERITSMLSLAADDEKNGIEDGREFMLHSIIWLAEKLKEVNDECAKYSAELHKLNEEYIAVLKGLGRD